jgi:hypothetical protein
MIILDCPQGSAEWHQARVGIPTASCFDKILTPKTMRPSASADAYADHLNAEWKLGRPIIESDSPWMHRGGELEESAALWYAVESDAEPRRVGFVMRDDKMVGCSPDRLVGDDGILEIKCPKIQTHLGYRRLTEAPADYRCQLQGQLWVTGREWVDFMSFCPGLPAVLIRVERDEAFIEALSKAVDAFVARLLAERESLVEEGVHPVHEAPRGPRSYGKALEEAGVTDAERQAWV